MFQAYASGRSITGQPKDYAGEYQHPQEVVCPLPSSNELRKKRSVSDKHIGTFYRIRVSNTGEQYSNTGEQYSNTGEQYSDEIKVSVYHKTCVSCNSATEICTLQVQIYTLHSVILKFLERNKFL